MLQIRLIEISNYLLLIKMVYLELKKTIELLKTKLNEECELISYLWTLHLCITIKAEVKCSLA